MQQVQATHNAFAAILEDGSVVTWGDPDDGGDSSAVQDQLKSVRQVQATYAAFAAILEDGSVVTWGHPGCGGGDSSAVQDQLEDCAAGSSHRHCICCHLGRWLCCHLGRSRCGGDSSAVQDQLKSVRQVQATGIAFAAILEDGSVVTWGSFRLWR